MILVLRDIVVPTDGGSQLVTGLLSLSTAARTEVVISGENWGFATNLVVRMCYSRPVRRLRRYRPFSWLFIVMFYGVLRRTLQRRLLSRFGQRGISGVWCAANDILPLVGAGV